MSQGFDGGQVAALLDATPDAIVAVDEQGRIVLVNAETERLFDYRPDELVGETIEVLVPEYERVLQPMREGRMLGRVSGEETNRMAELAARRRDGSEFAAEVFVHVVETGQGPLVSTAIRDVTDRRRAEAQLAEFAAIFATSHDAIVSHTLGGTITNWNEGASRLYGYEEREVVGHNISMLIPEHRRVEDRDLIERVARGERVEHLVTERLRRDSTLAMVSVTAAPIVDSGARSWASRGPRPRSVRCIGRKPVSAGSWMPRPTRCSLWIGPAPSPS